MFSVKIGDAYSVSVQNSKEKSLSENAVQTEIFNSSDKDTQLPERHHVQIQTESIKKSNIFADYDVASLTSFLNNVTPYVCSVLEKNSKSHAFDNYDFLDDKNVSISCIHILDKYSTESLISSCLSWNSVGSSIAVAYSQPIHESWCEHDGSIGIWSLNRKNFDSKKPNTILETDCCITCIAFHPEKPALLLAGKFSGEIMLWNIAKEDDALLGTSAATVINHREPVTGLYWLHELYAYSSEKYEFASCSLDGKILLWKYENKELLTFDGFIVLTDQLPRNFSIKSSRENSEVGVLSLSINNEDQSIFVMSTEGGGVLQGSMNSLVPASYSGLSSVPLKNPISMCFERHKGQVTSIQFSTFSRNIFLSSGTDGELRIYSLLQAKPVNVLYLPNSGINDAKWLPTRPLVINCITDEGYLHVWDLTRNTRSPTESFQLDEKISGVCLQINIKSSNLVATSTSNGKIQIWELPKSLLEVLPIENQLFQELTKVNEEN